MTLGLVCHDAGAANMLLSYISEKELTELCGYFEGPAQRIQNEYLPYIRCMDSVNEVIQASDTIITGSGWQSNLEFETRRLAASSNKYSIAVVDHWTNYRERFCRDGQTMLPNEIWVFDEPALARAKRLFPSVKLKLMPSSYEKHILAKVGLFRPVANRLLYLCEPMRIQSRQEGEVEIEVLKEFLERLSNNVLYRDFDLHLRLHPSEKVGKYDALMSRFKSIKFVHDNCDLHEAIGKASAVVGCSSYALYLAYKAGRRIISSMPKSIEGELFDIREIIAVEDL